MRKVTLTYFKSSGKYYSSGEYETEHRSGFDYSVYDEVREMKENGDLPGLESGTWDGPILIEPDEGIPAIIFGTGSDDD